MTKEAVTATIWTRTNCPAYPSKENVGLKTVPWVEKKLNSDANKGNLPTNKRRRSVPQIFIGGVHIGGFDSLEKYSKEI